MYILRPLVVFVPEEEDGTFKGDYLDQVEWEQSAMGMSDIILFWIPRDLVTLPGFTTNVEFGLALNADTGADVVLGYPEDAPKMKYLSWLYTRSTGDRPMHTMLNTWRRVTSLPRSFNF